jgi:shikimate dehydrogenase
MISARTGVVGLIGWPVQHSHSPPMHNAALAHLGFDLTYLAFAVAPERVAEAIRGAAALSVRGLNVTIPHKEAALSCCEPDELAMRAGAVNTLTFADSRVVGTNTDVAGFIAALDELRVAPDGEAVILGAGGAARAALVAFQDRHQAVSLWSRTPRALVVGGVRYESGALAASELAIHLKNASILVDATPRGLGGTAEKLGEGAGRLDLSPLPASARVLDLAVRRSTPLIEDARARGLQAATGATMLLYQGAASLSRWIGVPAPLEVMRAALEASLAAEELVP